MKSYIAFLTLSSLLLLTTKTNARTDPAEYWNKFVNNEPLPELLKGLLDVTSKERTVPDKENIPFYPNSENENSNPMQYWNRVMKGEPIPDSIKDLLDANSKERRVPQMDKSYVYQVSPDEKEATQSSKPTRYWNSVMKGEPIPDSIRDLLDANSKERRVPQMEKSYVYQISGKESSNPTQYWDRVMKGEAIPEFIKDLLDASSSKERRVPQMDKSYVYAVVGAHK